MLGPSHMEYIMSPSPVPQVSLTTVATFPKNYFLENLAVRADNSVLVTAFILIDAKPVEVNGTEMRTVFPTLPKRNSQ